MALSRRNLFMLGGAAAAAGGLAACGGASGGGGGGGSQELSILTPIFADSTGKQILEDEIGGSFDSELTLSVDYTPWDRLNEKISTGIAGGLSTDVIMSGVGWVPPFAHKGVFSEIDESVLEGLGIHEKLLDTCRFDGGLYALPYMMDGRMLIANRQLLDERGLTEQPETLEDFRELLKEAQGGDVTVPLDMFSNNIRQTWIHLMGAYGGSMFTEDGSAVAFDDGTGEAALEFMIGLIEDGSTDFDVRLAEGQPRPWQQKQVLFEINSSAFWPAVKEQSPDMLGEDVLEPWMMPGSQGNDPVMFLGGTLVSVGGGAQDPERATEFIRHLYQPELLAMTSIDDGQVPAVADLPQDEELLSNRLLTFVNDNLDHTVASEGGSPAWMEIRGTLNGQIEACVTGQQSPADTIAQIKSDAEQAISRI